MSGPFNSGRDSNAAPSSDMFDDYQEGPDKNSGEFMKGFDWTHNNLGEMDYRDADNKS